MKPFLAALSAAVESGAITTNRPKAMRSDAIVNASTGMGTAYDKTVNAQIVPSPVMSDMAMSILFHSEDLARRLIEKPADDCFKKGFKIVGLQKGQSEKLTKQVKQWKANAKLREAWIWDRNYGGSAIILGTKDHRDAWRDPLHMRANHLTWLRVVDRRYLSPASWDTDPASESFGEPLTYYLTPASAGTINEGTLVIHRSRMVIFQTELTDAEERARRNSWSVSIHELCLRALMSFHSGFASADQLLASGHQGVYKIKNFSEILASKSMDLIYARLNAVDLYRSVLRAIVVDAENEDFEWKTASLTELSNVLTQYGRRISSAGKMPYSVLMSDTPSGLNATGESDLSWWYSQCGSWQTLALTDPTRELVQALALNAGMASEEFEIEWPSLWEPSPTQRADLRLKGAQSDAIYVTQIGMVSGAELALMRMRPDGWNDGYELTDEQRAARERDVTEMLKDEPEAPTNDPDTTPEVPLNSEDQPEAAGPPGREPADQDDARGSLR